MFSIPTNQALPLCYNPQMQKTLLILSLTFFLAACDPPGTSVFNRDGTRVGRVSVESSERATIYNREGSRVGSVSGRDIFDRNDTLRGRVRTDKAIENRDGTRVGSVNGKDCFNDDGGRVGNVSSVIDTEAGGGACLLLLLGL